MRAPTLLVGLFQSPRSRLSCLIEQDQHGLSDPIEDLHLRRDIAGVDGIFGRVDEIEHDISTITRVLHRLLARPERTIAPTVPYFREKPADRIAALREPFGQAHAIAETGRVPQAQHIAIRGLDHRVRLCGAGHMRFIADFADVGAKQRPRERGLARVGVGDKTQVDRIGHAAYLSVLGAA